MFPQLFRSKIYEILTMELGYIELGYSEISGYNELIVLARMYPLYYI